MAESGKRAILLFAVLHSGINSVTPAAHIDGEYAKLIKLALNSGVEVLAYQAKLSSNSIQLSKKIAFIA